MFEFIQNYGVFLYFALISAVAFVITVYDKIISKKPGVRRVPEATLLLISALGGSVCMFATMLLIRHKTKHAKFMIGIPLIMIVQAGLIVFFILKK